MKRGPEVLAPAGDEAALRAAVRSGADAVYFGLRGFNARARAANFDAADLTAVMQELHAHGVRGYVALNTLVFDDELPALEAAARACAGAGVDAVIVQDLGVARVVRDVAPSVAIHASTQMTCTDAAGVVFAREAGARRVVLARELSLDEIARIRAETDVELEVFVHGALCIAYSGQCLTSEAIGGRSANRGACAQACRLPYRLVVDGAVRDLGDRAFLLSPEDLDASALVPDLVRLGVSALKIEGRLKGADYVAAVTSLYRLAVDRALAAEGARAPRDPDAALDTIHRDALQTYTRGSGAGFLAGVDHQRLVEGRTCDHRGPSVGRSAGVVRERGRTMVAVALEAELSRGDGVLVEGAWAGEGEVGGRIWALAEGGREVERAGAGSDVLVWLGPDKRVDGARSGARVFKTSDPKAARAVAARLDQEPYRVPLDVRVSGRIGEPFVLDARSARGQSARVEGGRIERARSGGAVGDVLLDKLGRLGDTPFVLRDLAVDVPVDALIPPSSINRARRAMVEALASSSTADALVPEGAAPPERSVTRDASVTSVRSATRAALEVAPPLPGLFVLCRSEAQAHAAADAGADGIVLDFLELTGTGAALRSLRARQDAPLVVVAPPRIRKPGEEKIDRYLRDLAPDAILVRSLGALQESSGDAIPRIGDFSLNVTNRVAAAEVLGRGLAAFTPSFDLDASQLLALLDGPLASRAEVVVHHPMPLFHMEHCVFAALLSEGRDHRTCGRPCESHVAALQDRAGMQHPIVADVGCRNTVFHAAAQSAVDLMARLQSAGVRRFRVELVREDAAEAARIVRTYRAVMGGTERPADARRALKAAGGYGVVTGSLRVLPS